MKFVNLIFCMLSISVLKVLASEFVSSKMYLDNRIA